MLRIVSTRDRPDLVGTTGLWRWEAFFRRSGVGLDEVMDRERACAEAAGIMPTVLVLLENDSPAGMVALCEGDLEGRPELDPWLAGLYVAPAYRRRGHARRLVAELESFARTNGVDRLSLYTAAATGLYRRCGWRAIEQLTLDGETYTIMQKPLSL